jgi:RimJ/RimL family protein N-acetyltransferase
MPPMALSRLPELAESASMSDASSSTSPGAAGLPLLPWRLTLDERNRLRQQIREGTLSLRARPARMTDKDAILEMIEEAKQWLPTIGTDQWSTDWKDNEGSGRIERVEHSLKDGTTWLVFVPFRDRELAIATVTIEYNIDSKVWSGVHFGSLRCAYLSRLVTTRDFAGLNIGAAVIDWACEYADGEFEAEHLRIDVWTTNRRLHDYYRKHGFQPRGYLDDKNYPSCARFDRPTGKRAPDAVPRIVRA